MGRIKKEHTVELKLQVPNFLNEEQMDIYKADMIQLCTYLEARLAQQENYIDTELDYFISETVLSEVIDDIVEEIGSIDDDL